ncbi:hypothetical protein HII13_005412 [Brettanomyces bruxellensis]|nr:hypothetical protein HII13_005412 [Brettanomyces bruxellensis]
MVTSVNPVPKYEETVYNALLGLQTKLLEAKADPKYSDNKEIQKIYKDVLEQITALGTIRDDRKEDTAGSVDGKKPTTILNKVDVLIDEIFQLLSLFFVSFGLSNTAPATYASLTTVQRLLIHLEESRVYTRQDLEPIKERLDEISKIIEQASIANQDDMAEVQRRQAQYRERDRWEDDSMSEEEEEEEYNEDEERGKATETEIQLLRHKLAVSYATYDELSKRIQNVPPEVQTLIDELLSIKYRVLQLMSESGKRDASRDMKNYHKSLNHLARKLERTQAECDVALKKQADAPEKKDAGNSDEGSEAVLKGLLDDCHNYLSNLQMGVDRVDPHLRPLYQRLILLHSKLSKLLVTRRWSMRTVDLYSYQKELGKFDKSRVGGFFGSKDYKGQSVLLYLLRSCYAIVYKLLESSEPVSEALQPLHNQLSTVHRCLLDLKRSGGVSSLRELYPYQLKLTSIDNEAVDGVFKVNGQIPPGQATLTALLSECFDILHELKVDYYDTHEDIDESTLQTSNDKAANIIGTKALQESTYDYNDVGEENYNEAEDNLADYPSSYNSDEESDPEEEEK